MDSAKIISGRYNDLLKGLDIGSACEFFLNHNQLTLQDVQTVLKAQDETSKKRTLSSTLASKGTRKFTEISTMIRKFRKTILSNEREPAGKLNDHGTDSGEIKLLARAVSNTTHLGPPKGQQSTRMDPFSILFFTFMSQLKSFLTSGPSWLTDDVHDDSISDYFPPGVTKVLSQKSVPMKLSVLLEAFQQLITKSFDEGNEDSDDQLKNLQRLYEQSEERCKQLVVVTQQWALECGDKDKALAIYESETKQLKEIVAQLERRVGKYKKYWQDNRSLEEMRTELEQRRIFYDKMQEEKDKQIQHLARENQQLSKTVERLKDHLAEAEDRLGNMKLQVSVKEPTVREMTKLRAELRESESKNQQLLDEKRELEDKIIALSITIEEYEVLPAQQPPSVPKPLPIRTQAMVTGFPSHHYKNRDPVVDHIDADDDESTSSDESLPSSHHNSLSKSVEVDPTPANLQTFEPDFSFGLPAGDYTRGTRYPSHSTIEVAPLDKPSRCGGDLTREKVCPSCHQSFLTLSEQEFQSHVANCFK